MTTTFKIPYPKDLLPHRPPMLLIDRVDNYDPGQTVQVSSFITPDNRFFEGHFPGEPILPGIILVEMMFQACGIFGRLEGMFSQANKTNTANPALPAVRSGRAIKIDRLTFTREVRANDQLIISVKHRFQIMKYMVFDAKVEIAGKGAAAKGEVTVLIA
ncbi:3-hydroxyacyl-ACP dehydratase FabZ family protein [Spirosoma validum]|uniref:Beta-hydroxyacyl-ACP dehydratase n=1 Tax=Spirosoma validum TaxID=2771355 RepID=A0A927GDY9_9BACT|nr:FabA/FabZ family ACP-dehydratase [Spirosoma validum]MBD2754060.1 hypothetical protein [Spirosoma validum]